MCCHPQYLPRFLVLHGSSLQSLLWMRYRKRARDPRTGCVHFVSSYHKYMYECSPTHCGQPPSICRAACMSHMYVAFHCRLCVQALPLPRNKQIAPTSKHWVSDSIFTIPLHPCVYRPIFLSCVSEYEVSDHNHKMCRKSTQSRFTTRRLLLGLSKTPIL